VPFAVQIGRLGPYVEGDARRRRGNCYSLREGFQPVEGIVLVALFRLRLRHPTLAVRRDLLSFYVAIIRDYARVFELQTEPRGPAGTACRTQSG
jgi:hypothetical protein